MTLRLKLALAGTVLGLAAAAGTVLALASRGEPAPAADVATPAEPTAPRAPAFSLQTVDGQPFSLADADGRAVVLEFLAPGCPECRVDVAVLAQAARRYGDEVRVVIADVSGAADLGFLRDYYRGELGAPRAVVIASDIDFEVARRYGVRSLGETFVIGPDGRIEWQGRWSGDAGLLFGTIERSIGA